MILILVGIWKSCGYSLVIYLCSITAIDRTLYESASLDGATFWQKAWHITLPMLRPTIATIFILSIGSILNSDFGLFYQVPMDSGAIYETTQTIDTYVYRGLMKLNDVGMSSAAGLFQSILGFIIVITANAIVRHVDSDNALF